MTLNRSEFATFQPSRRQVVIFGAAGAVLAASGRGLVAQPAALQLQAEVLGSSGKELGINGSSPGPILHGTRGKALVVSFKNTLARPVSLYWPGVRGAPDFLASTPISPGETRDVSLTPRDAGTFWYRAFAPSQSEHGLHGLLIVEDDVPVDREIPIVLWAGNDPGTVRANGQRQLLAPVRAGERVRFRLLNASRATIMAVRFDEHDPVVVAVDGHPAEPFGTRDRRVVLAPGGRADVIVDMTLAPGVTMPIALETPAGGAEPILLRYGAERINRPSALPAPAALPANPLPARMDFGRALRSELSLDRAAMRGPNPGQSAQRSAKLWGAIEPAVEWPDPAFAAKRGQTVMLGLRNDGAQPVVIHLQGHPFRLLDSLDDGWKPYWLDTILALPHRTTRIAFIADAAGKWPIVCQPLLGAGDPFVGWFETA